MLATLSLAGFAAIAGPLANLLAMMPQAELYGKTPTEVSYAVS